MSDNLVSHDQSLDPLVVEDKPRPGNEAPHAMQDAFKKHLERTRGSDIIKLYPERLLAITSGDTVYRSYYAPDPNEPGSFMNAASLGVNSEDVFPSIFLNLAGEMARGTIAANGLSLGITDSLIRFEVNDNGRRLRINWSRNKLRTLQFDERSPYTPTKEELAEGKRTLLYDKAKATEIYEVVLTPRLDRPPKIDDPFIEGDEFTYSTSIEGDDVQFKREKGSDVIDTIKLPFKLIDQNVIDALFNPETINNPALADPELDKSWKHPKAIKAAVGLRWEKFSATQ